MTPTFVHSCYPQTNKKKLQGFWASWKKNQLCFRSQGTYPGTLRKVSFALYWPKLGHTVIPEPTTCGWGVLRPGCLDQSLVRGEATNRLSRIRALPGTEVQTLNSTLAPSGRGEGVGRSIWSFHYTLPTGLSERRPRWLVLTLCMLGTQLMLVKLNWISSSGEDKPNKNNMQFSFLFLFILFL